MSYEKVHNVMLFKFTLCFTFQPIESWGYLIPDNLVVYLELQWLQNILSSVTISKLSQLLNSVKLSISLVQLSIINSVSVQLGVGFNTK